MVAAVGVKRERERRKHRYFSVPLPRRCLLWKMEAESKHTYPAGWQDRWCPREVARLWLGSAGVLREEVRGKRASNHRTRVSGCVAE